MPLSPPPDAAARRAAAPTPAYRSDALPAHDSGRFEALRTRIRKVGEAQQRRDRLVERMRPQPVHLCEPREKLGIDRQRPLYTSNRRPVYFGHGGQPIRELF